MVPLASLARAAISSTVVATYPFSANTRRAAAMISDWRNSETTCFLDFGRWTEDAIVMTSEYKKMTGRSIHQNARLMNGSLLEIGRAGNIKKPPHRLPSGAGFSDALLAEN